MIIADAEFIRNDLITNAGADPTRVCVIYNGVNVARFIAHSQNFEAKERFGIPRWNLVVTTVAKCIPEKGVDVFLRAASEISRNIRGVKFLVVGDGPLLESMKAFSARLGISDATLFLGLRSDVEEILAASDVFVLCSLWQEAFAFTLLEAMAAGVPVVASRIGAIPESVADGATGLLFTPGDSAGAAKAIETLLIDHKLRGGMGLSGRKRVETSFSMERWVNQTISVYEGIL
jgi:glycosyltransferase involved in cell wall biosynthesis